MKNIDKIHKWLMKNKPDYQNLSMDQRGEFCVKLSELFINYFGDIN